MRKLLLALCLLATGAGLGAVVKFNPKAELYNGVALDPVKVAGLTCVVMTDLVTDKPIGLSCVK